MQKCAYLEHFKLTHCEDYQHQIVLEYKHHGNQKYIYLKGIFIEDIFDFFSEITGFTAISFYCVRDLYPAIYEVLCLNSPNITSLEFISLGVSSFSMDILTELIENLDYLTTLVVSGCSGIADSDYKTIVTTLHSKYGNNFNRLALGTKDTSVFILALELLKGLTHLSDQSYRTNRAEIMAYIAQHENILVKKLDWFDAGFD